MRVIGGIGKTAKWLLIVGGLLVVIIVIAAAVGLSNASKKSDKSASQVGPARYAHVHLGMTGRQLRGMLGKPQSTDSTTVSGSTMNCWYYGVLASSATYQFCFENGRLATKSRY